MPGARCTRGLVCHATRRVHTSIQGSGEHPTFPAQWLYGLSRDLLGVPGFVVTVAREIVHGLDAGVGASGPRGFAVRAARFVLRASTSIASRFQRP